MLHVRITASCPPCSMSGHPGEPVIPVKLCLWLQCNGNWLAGFHPWTLGLPGKGAQGLKGGE